MRILLAEDDASLGEGIQTALKRAAFAVDWVKDGSGALAAINDGNIDLVVLDLGLPRVDGIEVIRQVRASGGNVPILVLSARERSADRTLGWIPVRMTTWASHSTLRSCSRGCVRFSAVAPVARNPRWNRVRCAWIRPVWRLPGTAASLI